MRIIYTCPKCGSDIDDVVLTTYPPKYMKVCRNPKCDWQFIEEPEEDITVRVPYEPPKKTVYADWTNDDNLMPSCCRGCWNNPRNGGSGNCNCTLPYMTKEWGITC